jgi:hypothetical protein
VLARADWTTSDQTGHLVLSLKVIGENASRRYNDHEMSRLFESFEFLDRGWDARVLEAQSLRSVFLWLLAIVFLLGADAAFLTYQVVHLHRLDWSIVLNLVILGFIAFRYARIIYRRLLR